jgi:hypothetical protein
VNTSDVTLTVVAAGLPSLFAIGLVALSRGPKTRAEGADSDVLIGGNPLGSQLTNDEVAATANELSNESNPDSKEAIKHAIATVTSHHEPNDADFARVRSRLAAGGWPLAAPKSLASWPE